MPTGPRLRTAGKTHPLYTLNAFSKNFAMSLGREIIYLVATRPDARLEGNDWEEIFSRCIGAVWTPSNIGLDDVTLAPYSMTWGAKTVKNTIPFTARHIRLISGRNSLDFSYGIKNVRALPDSEIGTKVLEIWNTRVEEVRTRFSNVRTVVLLKGDNLTTVAVYEEDTVQFLPEHYYWQWNERGNLEGYEKATNIHRFTWQPHGSQFTIVSDVPNNRLKLRIRKPPVVSQSAVLSSVHYEDSWIEIVP